MKCKILIVVVLINPFGISQEQAIALTAMFVVILGPSGWILAHLEDYKKKQ